MPRRLVAINVVLGAVSVLCVAFIVKQIATVRPTAAPRSRPPVAAPAGAPPAGESRSTPQAYNVIAARNLFSPTRTESAGPALAGNAPAVVAKPNLHGVVLREGSPIAYLEDPLTKRIAGYRIGDPIAGGTVQTISADAVVISRPDGMVDVRLRDPSKPRPAPPQPAAQPAVPGGGTVPKSRRDTGAGCGSRPDSSARLHPVRDADGSGPAGTAAAGDPAAPAERAVDVAAVHAALAESRTPAAADGPGPVGPAAADAEPVIR
jgi:hypothetical protein